MAVRLGTRCRIAGEATEVEHVGVVAQGRRTRSRMAALRVLLLASVPLRTGRLGFCGGTIARQSLFWVPGEPPLYLLLYCMRRAHNHRGRAPV
jgi:hypothetical protein